MNIGKTVSTKSVEMLACVVLMLLFSNQLYAIKQNIRKDSLINFNWKFTKGDFPNAKEVTFDDKKWETVQLPHDASIYGAFYGENSSKENGFRPRHIGWYRKTFTPTFDLKYKKVFIEFEGVYRDAEVWVNGKYLGKNRNGYVGFTYDITSHLIAGKENVIAVRYDNTYVSSRWYSGEGIYRNVRLHVTNPVYVAESGTYITTPFVTDEKANISFETEVINASYSANLITLKTEVFTPEGKLAKTVVSTVPVKAGETYIFKQFTSIEKPQRWDIEHPNRYMAKSSVVINGNVSDIYNTTFGIRTVEFDTEKGFLLNGRKVFLKGVNLHHDLGPLGAAFYEKGMKRRLLGLKEMGVNAIRLAHNPHAKAVLDMCDEMGILVYDECFDKWDTPTWNHYGKDTKFDDYWRNDLAWFLKRDRNHPSVFIWSVGNEVFDTGTFHLMDSYFVPMLKNMVEFVHQHEPSRFATCGLFPHRSNREPVPMAFHMDIMSSNYLAVLYAEDHKKYPQLVFIESEISTRNGGTEFYKYDHSYTCGQFYWGGTDYIGESVKEKIKGWNGLIDWCDFWKPQSYMIQSMYSDKPMVKIAVAEGLKDTLRWNNVSMNSLELANSWNWNQKQYINLLTFTNCDEVELLLNGKTLGVKKMKDYIENRIPWNLSYEAGTLKAIARKNGQIVAVDELKTAGKPTRIILSVDTPTIVANGMDLAYVTATVVDAKGVIVPDANNDIQFSVEGVGTLAGVGNGDLYSDELFVANNRKAYKGKCLLIVRSGLTAGTVKIKATAKTLSSASVTIQSVK
jgi:beta-galactosidase